jgi:membrane protein DedA with SNARE-associated domain
LAQAKDLLARRGATAVSLGRGVAHFRAVMTPWPAPPGCPINLKFLAYNAAGGLTWGTLVVLPGYAAGAFYASLEHTLGTTSALIVAIIALPHARPQRMPGATTRSSGFHRAAGSQVAADLVGRAGLGID